MSQCESGVGLAIPGRRTTGPLPMI
jgi:hypothetical protein